MYDLIIIGGGPAGITAGIYAARQKLNILLITKEFGGQIAKKAVAIENYPGFEKISGMELIQKFEKQLRKQKIDIERDGVIKVKKIGDHFLVITKSKNRFESKAVIVASGADPRALKVEGEKKFLGKGLSYCVTCDGPLFEGKNVAIIGGGNSAFEAALFLAKIAKKIYILEYGKEVKADFENQEKVKKTGKVEIITQAAVKEIKGEKFVNSLTYEDRVRGQEITLEVEGVFVEIGNQPATSFIKDLVDFNERDEIIIDLATCQTKTPGLFAAGDVTQIFPKQIVVAAGEGVKAVVNAFKYINGLKTQEKKTKN